MRCIKRYAAGTSTPQIAKMPMIVGQSTEPLPRIRPLSTAELPKIAVAPERDHQQLVRDVAACGGR